MGVDYFECDNCGEVVNDCMDNARCAVCGGVICEECKKEVYSLDGNEKDYDETLYVCRACYDGEITDSDEHKMLIHLIEKYNLDWDTLKEEVLGKGTKYEQWLEKERPDLKRNEEEELEEEEVEDEESE